MITVRGQQLLQEADLVIYAGSLVNPQLLELTKHGCQIHNSASMTLDQVIDVLTAAYQPGKSLVRLHTGDPAIYGAIKEQMDRLDLAGIPYQVVPGVSSFCGAAAALKAELTLPAVSQTVILTRMEGRTPVPAAEDLELLASHRASLVLFLSSSLLQEASQKLIKGGYQEDTPAAIVYKATWPEEKIVHTSLGQLAAAAQAQGITKTALILVGDFLAADYELSKLYDASFSHEFRQGQQA